MSATITLCQLTVTIAHVETGQVQQDTTVDRVERTSHRAVERDIERVDPLRDRDRAVCTHRFRRQLCRAEVGIRLLAEVLANVFASQERGSFVDRVVMQDEFTVAGHHAVHLALLIDDKRAEKTGGSVGGEVDEAVVTPGRAVQVAGRGTAVADNPLVGVAAARWHGITGIESWLVVAALG